jgi:hypothetical protein
VALYTVVVHGTTVALPTHGALSIHGPGFHLGVTVLGADGLLHVNESVTVRFSIGLGRANLSTLTIDANGTPHDWTHEAPPLGGPANNASFVFALRTVNPLYLPLVAK